MLTTKANKSADLEGYSLYSYGDITIRGNKTDIKTDDGTGISADGRILIEGGRVNTSSTDVALLGWDGVQVTGGTVKAHSAPVSYTHLDVYKRQAMHTVRTTCTSCICTKRRTVSTSLVQRWMMSPVCTFL